MIKLNNITHAYGDKPVLQDLSLNIESNQLTCLLGGSGNGKTTILRLIAGLEVPTNGQIIIQDKIVSDQNKIIIPPYQRNLGYIFQDLALWPHFTVYKNIAFGLNEHRKKNVKDTVFKMLDFFGLQEYAEKYPHQLSGGQQQLVAISRALVLKPKILLMDEPLANLDVKLKRKILEHIKNLKKSRTFGNNLTIVYVTHDHKEALTLADTIVVLNEGKIEETGNRDQIINSTNEFVQYFIEV